MALAVLSTVYYYSCGQTYTMSLTNEAMVAVTEKNKRLTVEADTVLAAYYCCSIYGYTYHVAANPEGWAKCHHFFLHFITLHKTGHFASLPFAHHLRQCIYTIYKNGDMYTTGLLLPSLMVAQVIITYKWCPNMLDAQYHAQL